MPVIAYYHLTLVSILSPNAGDEKSGGENSEIRSADGNDAIVGHSEVEEKLKIMQGLVLETRIEWR